jgi:NAD(P)-dependent dehydrogenase (short-subunit alcohol dehydrogenase family)
MNAMNAIGTIVVGAVFALTMATGCAKELDTSACQACAANGAKVDAAASRAESAANRAEAAAQRAESAAQRAEAMFNKSTRK